MREIERQIIDRLVDDILAAGHGITIHDGEDYALTNSRNKTAIMAEIGATDETTLFVYEGQGGEWVQLIHGNDADVIANYAVAASHLVAGAMSVAAKFY